MQSDLVSLTQRYFEAVGSGDRTSLMDLLDEDVIYRFPGKSSFAGDYVGREAVMAYLKRLARETEGSLEVRVRDILTGQHQGAGVVEATAKRGSKSLTWSLVALIESKAGKIKSITLYYRDQYGIDEFLGGAVPADGVDK